MGEKHGSDSGGELGAIGLQFHQMSRRKDNVGGRQGTKSQETVLFMPLSPPGKIGEVIYLGRPKLTSE